MNRNELITNALLDKYGSGINFYTSSDILITAGISSDEDEMPLRELKASIDVQMARKEREQQNKQN